MSKAFFPARRLLWLALAALVIGFAGAVAGATAPVSPAIVALAYDSATKALLKAQPDGIYRSTDEASSWQPIPLPTMVGRVTAIATPADGSGAIYVAGPSFGILRGDADGGWKAIVDGLPSRNVAAFATHATQPDTLYAYLPESGIYRSQDAGTTWKLMDRGPEAIRQLVHSDMAGSMETGWLYAATAEGASVSMDCFCLWRDIGDLGGAVTSIAYRPGQPESLYAATERGVFRSDSGGRKWQQLAAPGSPVTALTVMPSGTVYAATSDGTLYRSDDSALSWKQVGA